MTWVGRIIKFITNLSSVVKGVITVVSFLGMLGGGYLLLQDKIIARYERVKLEEQKETEFTELQQNFQQLSDTIVKYFTLQSIEMINISDRLSSVETELSDQHEVLVKVKDHMIETAVTKEEVQKMYDIWEDLKKKSGSNSSLIPFAQNSFKTVSE